MEDGTVTLIGATTENPSFYVVSPLLSRARTFKLELLDAEDVQGIVRRALADEESGLGGQSIEIDDETVKTVAVLAGGDARTALNILEFAVSAAELGDGGAKLVTRDLVEEAAQHPTLLYDRQADAHYDTISAFIKTVRDSDADGALYWLARMLEAGEDPLFVARRLVILAAEDVGLADPQALPIAVACQQAVHFLGMPEARLPMGRGDDLLGARAEVELRIRCLQPRAGRRGAHAQRRRAAAPAQRRHRAHARVRLRPGLPVRPRLRGPRPPRLADPPPALGGGQRLLSPR